MISSSVFLFLPLSGAFFHVLLQKHFETTCKIANLLLGILLILSLLTLVNIRIVEPYSVRLFLESDVHFDLRLLYDSLAQVMVILISLIGLVVHQYASRYLYSDRDRSRFMAQLCLLISSVVLLVMSGNLLTSFIGWQCIGFTLYWLLNHYHYDSQANRAAKKKFIINRLGDMCFLLAVVLCFQFYATTDFQVLLHSTPMMTTMFDISISSRTLILGLVFIAVMTKSAQFPFHIWLPDTMQAPTPVSAIMHAGVINAGGFMLVRLSSGLVSSPGLLIFITSIGILTLMFGSLFAIFQFDSKKQLAYSTMSQMGYMVLQCGVGCFVGAMFHLVMHGFFKAFSFLNIGNSLFLADKNSKKQQTWVGLLLNISIALLMLCVLLWANSQFFKDMMLYPLLVFFMFITLLSYVTETQTEAITWKNKVFLWVIWMMLTFFYLKLLHFFQLDDNNFFSSTRSLLTIQFQIILISVFVFFKLIFYVVQLEPPFFRKISIILCYFSRNKFFIEEFYRYYTLNPIRYSGDVLYKKLGSKSSYIFLYFIVFVILFLISLARPQLTGISSLLSFVFLIITLLMANRATTLMNMILYLVLSQYLLSCLSVALPGLVSKNIAYYQLINTSLLAAMFVYILMKEKNSFIISGYRRNKLPWLSAYLTCGFFCMIALPMTPSFITEVFIMKQLVSFNPSWVIIFIITMILLAIVVLHALQEYIFSFSMGWQFAIKLTAVDHAFCLAIIFFNVINGFFPLFFIHIISAGVRML